MPWYRKWRVIAWVAVLGLFVLVLGLMTANRASSATDKLRTWPRVVTTIQFAEKWTYRKSGNSAGYSCTVLYPVPGESVITAKKVFLYEMPATETLEVAYDPSDPRDGQLVAVPALGRQGADVGGLPIVCAFLLLTLSGWMGLSKARSEQLGYEHCPRCATKRRGNNCAKCGSRLSVKNIQPNMIAGAKCSRCGAARINRFCSRCGSMAGHIVPMLKP